MKRSDRLRVAAFSPGPPQPSGGAHYAGWLLPALAERVEVTTFCPPEGWRGSALPPDAYDPADFDVTVHFLGNSADHVFAYQSAVRWGGVVMLHDVAIWSSLWEFSRQDALGELEAQVGKKSAARLTRRWELGASRSEVFLLPSVTVPLRRAEHVIVHSRYAQLVIDAEAPGVPSTCIPIFTRRMPGELYDIAELRRRLGLGPTSFVVGLFGYLAMHKRIPEAIEAVGQARRLLTARGVELALVIVGAHLTGSPIEEQLRDCELAGSTIVTGFVEGDDFFRWMGATNAVINLRFPTAGESSAVLAQAMRLGKPVITSDYAQFSEERAAIRVPVGEGEVEAIADALVRLATCEPCRKAVSDASLKRALECDLDAVAARWARTLGEVATSRRAGARSGSGRADRAGCA